MGGGDRILNGGDRILSGDDRILSGGDRILKGLPAPYHGRVDPLQPPLVAFRDWAPKTTEQFHVDRRRIGVGVRTREVEEASCRRSDGEGGEDAAQDSAGWGFRACVPQPYDSMSGTGEQQGRCRTRRGISTTRSTICRSSVNTDFLVQDDVRTYENRSNSLRNKISRVLPLASFPF